MRLDKYISSCTPLSRKDVKKLIKDGAVTVDGAAAKAPDDKVGENCLVTVNGKPVTLKKSVCLMLNKPAGVVSAVSDRDYKTVIDLIGEEYSYLDLFPIGRLDIDTEGLLLLTNDGALSHALTSPSKNVYKTYFARLDKEAEDADIAAFSEGMEFKDFTAKSAVLEICENPKEVIIKIAEGKYHQVKRMCAKCGKNVVYLKRIAIGSLKLDVGLAPGKYRELNQEEEELLKNISGI